MIEYKVSDTTNTNLLSIFNEIITYGCVDEDQVLAYLRDTKDVPILCRLLNLMPDVKFDFKDKHGNIHNKLFISSRTGKLMSFLDNGRLADCTHLIYNILANYDNIRVEGETVNMRNVINLYTMKGCPKCDILKDRCNNSSIVDSEDFKIVEVNPNNLNDTDVQLLIEHNKLNLPILLVNNKFMEFGEAMKFIMENYYNE